MVPRGQHPPACTPFGLAPALQLSRWASPTVLRVGLSTCDGSLAPLPCGIEVAIFRPHLGALCHAPASWQMVWRLGLPVGRGLASPSPALLDWDLLAGSFPLFAHPQPPTPYTRFHPQPRAPTPLP